MREPFIWRSLTFRWDATEAFYACGRWTVRRPFGNWRGVWTGGSLMIAGHPSPESPMAALDALYLELNETCEAYREKLAALQAKVDLMRRDLDSLTDEDVSAPP